MLPSPNLETLHNSYLGGGTQLSSHTMNRQPHILILPFPAQGHIKTLLTLAELLCHAGIHVTFLNTEHNHRHLTHLQELTIDHLPTLHLESISDGLPADHPRSPIHRIPELISSIMSVTKPLFRELLGELSRKSERPVTCVIADGIMSFAIDFAKELGIRTIAFRVFSTACLWSFFCLPKLIEEGYVPVGGECRLIMTKVFLHNYFTMIYVVSMICTRFLFNRCRSSPLPATTHLSPIYLFLFILGLKFSLKF